MILDTPVATDPEARILAIQKRSWIGYPRAQAIRQQLDDLLNHPKVPRMPNLAIIGETNNGKSSILGSFYRRHQPPDDPNIDRRPLPILMIDTPPEPDEGRLYRHMLRHLFATVGRREPSDLLFDRLKVLLRYLDTKMIVLDGFNCAVAGTPVKQRRFLNALRLMGNDLQFPIVVAGTPETLAALQSDPQLANRFEPAFLPKWKLDSDYARLLMSVEKGFALQNPSDLAHPKFAQRLLDLSEGILGETMELLRRLAIRAIRSGEEQITPEMLKPDVLRSIHWVEPSRRTANLRQRRKKETPSALAGSGGS